MAFREKYESVGLFSDIRENEMLFKILDFVLISDIDSDRFTKRIPQPAISLQIQFCFFI